MTTYRKKLLNRVIEEQGFENLIACTMFGMSERYTSRAADYMLADLYEVMQGFEQSEQEGEEPNVFSHMGAHIDESPSEVSYEWGQFAGK